MRPGWFLSLVLHLLAAGVLATSFSLSWRRASELAPSIAVPVEVVDISDVTNMAPIAAPEPLPEQIQVGAEGAPQEDFAPAPAPTPAPAPKPEPPKKPQAQKPQTLDEFESLLNKAKKPGQQADPASADAKAGDKPRAAAGDRTSLTASEIDAIKSQMRECWRMPIDMAAPERLVVKVRVRFEADGSLSKQPELVSPSSLLGVDGSTRAAAEAALRAVRTCAPLRVNPKRTRGDVAVLNFDPREMAQ